VACDTFGGKFENIGVGKSVLERARLPNIDGLCRKSATGLLNAPQVLPNPDPDFEGITGMRPLTIDNDDRNKPIAGLFLEGRVEHVKSLSDFEGALGDCWNNYDFFHLRLDHRQCAANSGCDFDAKEWIEMMDAWVPGLMAVFRPDVFAFSGVWWEHMQDSGEMEVPIPLLIHSRRCRVQQQKEFSEQACKTGILGRRVSADQWLLNLMAYAGRI